MIQTLLSDASPCSNASRSWTSQMRPLRLRRRSSAGRYCPHKRRNWVVDLDLEKFFDRVNHDKLMSWVQERVTDRRVLQLIDQYLKAGALTGEGWEATTEGPPGWPPHSPYKVANFFFRDPHRQGMDRSETRY